MDEVNFWRPDAITSEQWGCKINFEFFPMQSTQGAGKNIIADGVIVRLFGCHALIATRK